VSRLSAGRLSALKLKYPTSEHAGADKIVSFLSNQLDGFLPSGLGTDTTKYHLQNRTQKLALS
jgi:hypothetical protein